MLRVRFSIPGKPRGWQRSGTADGRHYVKKETAAEMAYVASQARKAMGELKPATGPLMLTLDAVFEMPPSWPARVREMRQLPHVSKPDLDNIEKLILDALNGIVWLDDAQICEVRKCKRYGESERVDVHVEEMATTVDHPAVKSAVKRAAEGSITRRTERRKKPAKRTQPRAAEQTIGKRLR